MKKKKVLFVINTLGRAGAEVALLSLFSALDSNKYDISLYVIMAQGEMADELPSYVHLRNPYFSTESVLTEDGRKDLVRTVMRKNDKKWSLVSESIIYASGLETDEADGDYASR